MKWKILRSRLLHQITSELSLIRSFSLYKQLWKIYRDQRSKRNQKFKSTLDYILERNFGRVSIDKTVFNISGTPLSNEEETILSLGLTQYVHPKKTDKIQVFADMEQTAFMLSKENLVNEDKRAEIEASLRKSAHELSSASSIDTHTTRGHHKIITDLKKKGMALMRPDKGNGTVVMKSTQYVERMEAILNDTTKFHEANSDIDWNDHNGRRRVVQAVKQAVIAKQLPKEVLDTIPNGCTIPRLYGLAKVHKEGVPMRPVLSMINTAYHSTSRYVDERLLKPILEDFDEHSIKDSFQFQKKITNVRLEENEVPLSFDIKSLFTNIPVNETIDLICDAWYRGTRQPPKLSEVPLSEENCRFLLSTLAKDVDFTFGGKLYRQIDGLAMGSPLSGSFSQIFVGALERSLFQMHSVPKCYGRYVDDIFLIAKSERDGNDLLQLFNQQHTSIQFTKENGDHFLDVALHIDSEGCISTSIYRKQTFTGLYTPFQSFCPRRYKRNLVISLFHRARTLCSTQHLDDELKFLYKCLQKNGYPEWFIEKFSKPLPNKIPTVEKKKFYFWIPYYGEKSEQIAASLSKDIRRTFYHINPIPVFRTRRLASGCVKDTIPISHQPKVVYNFSCPCGARYVGKTDRSLLLRKAEHLPKWLHKGTTRPRSNQPPSSAITRHLTSCEHRVNVLEKEGQGFQVTKFARSSLELAITESVTIHQTLPDLCVQKERLFLLRLC